MKIDYQYKHYHTANTLGEAFKDASYAVAIERPVESGHSTLWGVLVAVVAVIVLFFAGQAKAANFAFQGYSLGMSLTDAKKLEVSKDWYDIIDKSAQVGFVCSDDNPKVLLGGSTNAPNVVECYIGYFRDGDYWEEAVFGFNADYNLTRASFSFVKDKSGEYRLFEIAMGFSSEAYPLLKANLERKYGASGGKVQAMQNGFGARFTNEIADWDNGARWVRLSKYGYSIKRGSLRYMDSGLFKLVQKKQEAKL